MICNMCPRRCGADRKKSIAAGKCNSPSNMLISRADLHFWEEPAISGKNGSGTIFFSGCNLGCRYCQNVEISRGGRGASVSASQLCDIMCALEKKGACNINFVTPSHYVHEIIRALKLYKPSVPVVYNCGGYESLSCIKALDGLVDVFLPDLKYSDAELSKTLSDAEDYFETACAAIKQMFLQTGKAVYDENGMIIKGTIVRHLILPGHVKNTFGVLKWLKNEIPEVTVSVMSQYFPAVNIADMPEMNRPISAHELERVIRYMERHEMENGWVQDRESADKKYVPPFSDVIDIL